MASALTALYFIVGIVLVMLGCAVFNICRSNALTEQRALNVSSIEELNLQATQRKEKKLSSAITRLRAALQRKEKVLKETEDTAALLTSRIESARDPNREQHVKDIEANIDSFDTRGRAMYGDAWDDGLDNGLPLREVFLMDEKEAAELRQLARMQLEDAREDAREAAAAATQQQQQSQGSRSTRQSNKPPPMVPKLNLGKLGIGGGRGTTASASLAALPRPTAAAGTRRSRRHTSGGSTSPPPPLEPVTTGTSTSGKRRQTSTSRSRRRTRRTPVEPTPLPPPDPPTPGVHRRALGPRLPHAQAAAPPPPQRGHSHGGGPRQPGYSISFDSAVGSGSQRPIPVSSRQSTPAHPQHQRSALRSGARARVSATHTALPRPSTAGSNDGRRVRFSDLSAPPPTDAYANIPGPTRSRQQPSSSSSSRAAAYQITAPVASVGQVGAGLAPRLPARRPSSRQPSSLTHSNDAKPSRKRGKRRDSIHFFQ